jgi:hypothetical protein
VDREQRIHARDLILRRRRRATDPRRQLLDVGALELNVSLGAQHGGADCVAGLLGLANEVVELPIDPRRCGLDEMPLASSVFAVDSVSCRPSAAPDLPCLASPALGRAPTAPARRR